MCDECNIAFSHMLPVVLYNNTAHCIECNLGANFNENEIYEAHTNYNALLEEYNADDNTNYEGEGYIYEFKFHGITRHVCSSQCAKSYAYRLCNNPVMFTLLP